MDAGPAAAAAATATAAATTAAGAAAAHAARESYGRLLAWLAWQWRDIAAAEDALAEAFASALLHWPLHGVPASPAGWLLTAAKRQLLQAARRRRLTESIAADPALAAPGENTPLPEPTAIPDNRLRLMFVCTHPAIAPEMHSALMLQTVLGLDAAAIAAAFLVPAETMAKRLVRAKAKIKAAGIRFEEPALDELPSRVHAVLEAIYGAYTLNAGHAPGEMAAEALFLARLVAACLPAEPEALGLLALLSLCESRRAARLDAQGKFVPLDRQDMALWDRALMQQAHHALGQAAAQARPGPLQIEAAIQAAHHHRLYAGCTPWADIVQLYERLLEAGATIGAQIGHAVATAQALTDPAAGLRLLDTIDAVRVVRHQPWWAARAHLLAAQGDSAAAVAAAERAIELTTDPALRRHLAGHIGPDSTLSGAD